VVAAGADVAGLNRPRRHEAGPAALGARDIEGRQTLAALMPAGAH
jgi:hypothetical protein